MQRSPFDVPVELWVLLELFPAVVLSLGPMGEHGVSAAGGSSVLCDLRPVGRRVASRGGGSRAAG